MECELTEEILFCGMGDAARWSCTDLYDDAKVKLDAAFLSSNDFSTGWYGCKKEIRTMRVSRSDERITIECSVGVDNLYDIADTIAWEVLGGDCADGSAALFEFNKRNGTRLTIRGIAHVIEDAYSEYTETCGTFIISSLDDLYEKMSSVEDEANKSSQDNYMYMTEIVRDYLSGFKEE